MTKSKIHKLLFILLVSLSLCFFVFFDKQYIGHDTPFHMYRLQGIVDAMRDGQFIPRIYPFANNEYGYATPLFYCEIFLIPFATLYRMGLPLVKCYQFMKAFYIVLSVVIMFFVSEKIFSKSKKAPYIATILYSYCNYHLQDLYIRDAFGENLAFCFVPLIFLSMYYVLVKRESKWKLLGISFALLLMSHAITFAMYCVLFGIAILFFIWKNRNDKTSIINMTTTVIKAVILAILLTSFYLFPMLEQKLRQSYMVDYYKDIFDVSEAGGIKEYIFTPFVSLEDYYSKYNNKICIFNLGYIFYFMQFLYVYALVKRKKKTSISFLFVLANVSIIFSIGFIPFKSFISFINIIQFNFRFNIIAFPALTFVITYSLEQIKNKHLYILVFLTITCYSLYNAYIIESQELNNYKRYETYEEVHNECDRIYAYAYDNVQISLGDYLPANDVYQYFWDDAKMIKIVDENRSDYYVATNTEDNNPLQYQRNGTQISFSYESKYNELIMLPLTYYKGYKIFARDDSDQLIRLGYEDIGRYKQVAFRSLVGNYEYVCYYDGTIVQNLSMAVSICSWAGLVVIILNKRLEFLSKFKTI